jgi:hypothetical protein
MIRVFYGATVVQCFSFFCQNQLIESSIQETQPKDTLYQTLLHVWTSFENYGFPSVTTQQLIAMVQPLCMKFLRRSSILLHVLEAADVTTFSFPETFDDLIVHLQLPSILELFNSPQLQKLVGNWCKQYLEVKDDYHIPRLGPIVSTHLIDLPNTFQDLVLKFVGVKCVTCGAVPKQGAVCLICGQLCCVASQCCFRNEKGECARHATTCGGGLFIMLKSTYSLIIRGDRRTAWGSLYLDEHGEEDIALRRGRPLYLSIVRYNELRHLWLASNFDYDSKVLGSTVRDGYYM